MAFDIGCLFAVVAGVVAGVDYRALGFWLRFVRGGLFDVGLGLIDLVSRRKYQCSPLIIVFSRVDVFVVLIQGYCFTKVCILSMERRGV